MTEASYTRDGAVYTPTDYVTGPWDPTLSHAGPPAGLLIDVIARSDADMGITRVTFEIPKGIPKVPATISLTELRPGRKIRLVEATLDDLAGVPLMVARAWLIRVSDDDLPRSDPFPMEFPHPESCEPLEFPHRGIGYMDAVEMRRISGNPFRGGPAAIWIRQTMPLVAGDETDAYARCGVFGDLGNGIAAMDSMRDLMAINTDLTLYLTRRPVSEWMAIRSTTVSHGLGLGISDSLVYDASGFVGTANQSLFIDRR